MGTDTEPCRLTGMTARIRLCRVSLGRIRLGRRIRYGWAYVAKPQESIAEQIGKAVLFTLAVIAIVAIVIALADSHHATKVVDAFGRTAVDIALAAPDWQDDDALPHDGRPGADVPRDDAGR